MIKKYGFEKAFYYINSYRESFNINGITRDNDLRNKIALSHTFHTYMASMSKEELFNFLKKYSHQKEKTSQEDEQKNIEKEFILEEASKLTYNSALEYGKDGKRQIFSALLQAECGNFDCFTKTNGARDMVANNISLLEILKIARMTLEKKGYTITHKKDIYKLYSTYIEYLCEEQKKQKNK